MSTLPNIEPTPRQLLEAVIAELGLSIRAEFVPFSRSRNKAEKRPSLNWRVTLVRNGRDILTTDYSAGCAHCPAYKLQGLTPSQKREAIARECETGREIRYSPDLGVMSTGKPILPDTVAVIWSLTRDADVLSYPGFEGWATDLGFDSDSRKAERIYHECLKHALALRNAIGQAGLDRLIEAGRDY